MPTLREMVDGTTISAAAPLAMKPSPTAAKVAPPMSPMTPPAAGKTAISKAPKGPASPMAKHLSDHMQDPVGATKEGFEGLTNAKLMYDQQRESMQRNLAPVQSVINHVSQMHNLDPTGGGGTPGMMPNQQDNTGVPGVPGGEGNEEYDQDGNPINTQQTVGKMNQSRPSQVGHQPGVAPGDGQTVRPPKMGMASPGSPTAQNSPQPGQRRQFGPTAPAPKGAGKLPGAKGPGDPKVANRTKKAQNGGSGKALNKGGGVNVTVHAAVTGVLEGGHNRLANASGLAMLRAARIKAGPEALNDKVGGDDKSLSYNPVMRSGKMKKCDACGEMHAEGKCKMSAGTIGMPSAGTHGSSRPSFDAGGPGSGRRPTGKALTSQPYTTEMLQKMANREGATKEEKQFANNEINRRAQMTHDRARQGILDAAGTSKGAKHRLSTKGQKHLSKKEKMAHWQTMDAGGPGSGRKPYGWKQLPMSKKNDTRERDSNLKSLAHGAKEGLRLASKLDEPKLQALMSKLHEHMSSGKMPTQAHLDAIGRHADRMDNKATDYADKIDYAKNAKQEDKYDKLADRYGSMSDHLEEMHNNISYHLGKQN